MINRVHIIRYGLFTGPMVTADGFRSENSLVSKVQQSLKPKKSIYWYTERIGKPHCARPRWLLETAVGTLYLSYFVLDLPYIYIYRFTRVTYIIGIQKS